MKKKFNRSILSVRSLIQPFKIIRSNWFVQSFIVRSLRSFVQLVRPIYAYMRALRAYMRAYVCTYKNAPGCRRRAADRALFLAGSTGRETVGKMERQKNGIQRESKKISHKKRASMRL